MKTSMPLDIHLSCRLSVKSIRGQPVDDRFRTHACERPHTRWVVPLISAHQRPAAAGDNTPRIIYGQGQDTRAHSNWPGPGPPRTTNKVTGMTRVTPAMKRSRGLSGLPVGCARERLHNAGEKSATIHTTYIAWPTVPPTFENRAAQRHRNRSYRRVVRCFGEAIRGHWVTRRRSRRTKVHNVKEALASDTANAIKQK